jgi:non-homologous end joining protein Ku
MRESKIQHDISVSKQRPTRSRSAEPSISEIDRGFFDAPYYITPNDPVGQQAFGVIREAMRSK